MSENESVTPVAGLSPPEMILVAILGGGDTHFSTFSAWSLKQDAERAGLTGVAVNLALRRLLFKRFVDEVTESDYNGNECTVYKLREKGWGWIEENEDRIVLHRSSKQELDDTPLF
jgi:hypothetical protein